MRKSVKAVYENGVLRPLEPLDLADQEQVLVVVSPWGAQDPENEPGQFIRAAPGRQVQLETVRRALAKIPGSLAADISLEREGR